MTELKAGDVVRFVTANPSYGTRFVVRAVDGGQAWVTSLSSKDVVKDRVLWIDGLTVITWKDI